jgi:hypothetical protein
LVLHVPLAHRDGVEPTGGALHRLVREKARRSAFGTRVVEAVLDAADRARCDDQRDVSRAQRTRGRAVVHAANAQPRRRGETRREGIPGWPAVDDRDRDSLRRFVPEGDAEADREEHGEHEGPEHRFGLAEEFAEANERELRERTVAPASRGARWRVRHHEAVSR